MIYTKCAANAVISSDGYKRIGFKGRSGVYFSHLDSTFVISSEYVRDADDNMPGVVLYVDSPWLLNDEKLTPSDIPKSNLYFVLTEVIEGLHVLGYRVHLSE